MNKMLSESLLLVNRLWRGGTAAGARNTLFWIIAVIAKSMRPSSVPWQSGMLNDALTLQIVKIVQEWQKRKSKKDWISKRPGRGLRRTGSGWQRWEEPLPEQPSRQPQVRNGAKKPCSTFRPIPQRSLRWQKPAERLRPVRAKSLPPPLPPNQGRRFGRDQPAAGKVRIGKSDKMENRGTPDQPAGLLPASRNGRRLLGMFPEDLSRPEVNHLQGPVGFPGE